MPRQAGKKIQSGPLGGKDGTRGSLDDGQSFPCCGIFAVLQPDFVFQLRIETAKRIAGNIDACDAARSPRNDACGCPILR